ncbi:glycosyltransferase [Macrococcoides canis]|uniref:Glycosyltransferase n=1 Tax=Macrococcoides canis TaxID=1855823 RepID=A0A4R6C1X5_9STAP|nr:glycosyltransferase [Macrococcus canis]TDM15258.1 glycosyltransferase [Macrococcus canis]
MDNLIISYGIYESDGRLQCLQRVFSINGKTTILSTTSNNQYSLFRIKKNNYLKLKTLLRFYLYVFKNLKQIRKSEVIIFDNYFVSPLAHILMKIYPNKIYIQDVRELYLFSELKTKKSKFFMFMEYQLMKKVNLVIAANEFRTEIMKKIYPEISNIITFENIRFLPKHNTDLIIKNKYDNLFTDRINVVSTGGLSVRRGVLDILESFIKLESNYHLYLIGGGNSTDTSLVNSFIDENNLQDKVTLIDKVSMDELQYIVSKCQIGIVNYHKEDYNNLYCSSGKIYEYLNEGLPIVTTDNPPLVELCKKNEIGIAGNNYFDMIKKVAQNIDFYKNNVKRYINNISPEKYNEYIASEIENIIQNKLSE